MESTSTTHSLGSADHTKCLDLACHHLQHKCNLSLSQDSFKDFSIHDFLKIFETIQEHISAFSSKLTLLQDQVFKLKQSKFLSSWVKVKTLKNFHLDSDPKLKDLQTQADQQEIILVLSELLTQAKVPVISPLVEIVLNDSDLDEEKYSKLREQYEDLLVSSLELKGIIMKNEGDQTQIRKLESELAELREKYELLEKVNKELSSKKNDSDDSLDLDCSNIKDMIEIQDLRAALRSMSERYEQEKENLIKDIIESRQDMETQIFRLQNEKNYTDVKLKEAEKQINDMNREKERLEGILITTKKEVERLKDCKATDLRTPGSRRGSSELQGSGDFELTESIDKLAVNSNDLYEVLQEELNEIAFKLQENGLIPDEGSTVQILKKSSELLISIKACLAQSAKDKIDLNDIPGSLSELLSSMSQELCSLSKCLQVSRIESLEKEKKIQELLKSEHFEIRTEPSPRSSAPGFELSSSIRHQLQLEKSKLVTKKHEIRLHKEQIAALKQNIRDLQGEIENSCKIDLGSLKDLWWAVGKEIPLLTKSTEDLIEAFMRKLGFNHKDFSLLVNERKSKKGKLKFGLF